MLDLSKAANEENNGHTAYMMGLTTVAMITVMAGVLSLFIDEFGLTTNQKYAAMLAYLLAGMWIVAGTQLRYYLRSGRHYWVVIGTIVCCLGFTTFIGWLIHLILA